jgi:hypothetical protein
MPRREGRFDPSTPAACAQDDVPAFIDLLSDSGFGALPLFATEKTLQTTANL